MKNLVDPVNPVKKLGKRLTDDHGCKLSKGLATAVKSFSTSVCAMVITHNLSDLIH
jgi:hypothetical protein